MDNDKGKAGPLKTKGNSQGLNQELEGCLHRIDHRLLQQDQCNQQSSSQLMNLQVSFNSLLAEIKGAKNAAIEENVSKEIIDDRQGKNQESVERLLPQKDQIIQELSSQMMDLQSSVNFILADDKVFKILRMEDSTIHQETMASKGCHEGKTGGRKGHFSVPVTRTGDGDRGNFLTPLARIGEYFTKNASVAVERLTFQELFNHQFLSQHPPNESLRLTLSGVRDASPLIESSNARPSGESSQANSLPLHLDEKSGGQDGNLSTLKSSGSIRSAHGFSIDNKVDKIPIGSPSKNTGVLSRCTNSQKQQEKTSCSQISLGGNVREAREDSAEDSLEIVDEDYVLGPGPPSSSSVNNTSGPRNSIEKFDDSPVEPQKSSSVCASVPITCRAISNTRAIGCLEDRSSPACGNSQRLVDTRDNIEQPSAHCMTRIESLKCCASLISELVRKEVAKGRRLEAFSVQLAILAIWKQAWRICESQTALATEDSPSHEARAWEGTVSVPSSRECDSSIDSPLSEAFCSQINRDFIAEIDYADELAKELAELGQFDENRDMPDAIEMIFQFALAFGLNGAVQETLENMERAASEYSKSICLLHFLLLEAPSLDCKPRFCLPDANRCRLLTYIDKLSSRHDHCRSRRSTPSQE